MLAAVAAASVLSACGSGSSAPAASKTVPPPATTAHLSTVAPAGSSPSSAPLDPAARRASAALLRPQELPAGFSETAGTDAPVPQPCLAPTTRPLLTRYPPRTHVARALTLASPPAILTEEIDVFASPTDAVAAGQAIIAGLHCTTGRLAVAGGTTQDVDVQGPADLRTLLNVPVTSALSWTLQTGRLFESYVVARSGSVLVMLTSLFPLSADTTKLPDGRAVAQTALRKVLAARLG